MYYIASHGWAQIIASHLTLRILRDPLIWAHPLDVIQSARSSYYYNVYVSVTNEMEFLFSCHSNEVSRDMTKPTKWLCTQRRLWSDWAEAKTQISLGIRPVRSEWTPRLIRVFALIRLGGSEDSDQPGHSPSLIRVDTQADQSLCCMLNG